MQFFRSGNFVGSFVSETCITSRFWTEQAANHTEHKGNQRTNTKNRSYQSYACVLSTQGKNKVHILAETSSEYPTVISKMVRSKECNQTCFAAEPGAPTSDTAVFNRCSLSCTAGSFLWKSFPWAVCFQPPQPMLFPSICSCSGPLPTFQCSFSFLLRLEHT